MDGSKANARFVDVIVEGASDCDDIYLRYKAIGDVKVVRRVRWAPESGADARLGACWYRVAARDDDDRRGDAHAMLVEDSSAGVAVLVVGGGHGLWLTREGADADSEGAAGYAESYLLLSRESVELS